MKSAQTALSDDSLPLEATPVWRRRWFQNCLVALLGILSVYGLIYRDVVARARESFEKGERYMQWHRDPEAKRRHFEEVFAAGRAAAQTELTAKKISEKEFQRRVDALEFDRDFALSESSIKYAYQWYKDAYELFSPPESRWVRESRAKAPEALELWKQELRAQKVPFEETMFE